MITTRSRAAVSLISLAAALTALAAGACAHGPSPMADASAPTPQQRLIIRFDNEAQTYVDVYLVGERREWWLGRVAPGAATTLRIPDGARAMTSGFVRLAVLAGAPVSVQAARDPRATLTIAQPAPELLAQRWSFAQRQLASPELLGTRMTFGRP